MVPFLFIEAAAILASWTFIQTLRTFLQTLRQYLQARRTGLPVLFAPFSAHSLPWILSHKTFAPILDRYLPFGLNYFLLYTRPSWPYRTKLHERYGPAFFIISPGETELIIADAAAAEEVLTRSKKDFVKPIETYKVLNIFGENLVSVNGEKWQRHRLITTPPFNERNSDLVWRESVAQAAAMLQSWVGAKERGVDSTNDDTMTLALNVLMSAGLGKPCSYGQENSGNHDSSFRDALAFILYNLGKVTLTQLYPLPLSILPKGLTQARNAVRDFKAYLTEMIEEERNSIVEKKAGSGDNLMSALVRSSEAEGRHSLSDEEICGNLFAYGIAGHDTTANTLAYAITRLSADVETQEWVREELSAVLGDQKELDYQKVFPQLKRCLAVMVSSSISLTDL